MTRSPRTPEPRLPTILVATDLSDHAHAAVKAAVHLIPGDGGDLHIVHAVPDEDQPIAGGTPSSPNEEPTGSPGPDRSKERSTRLTGHLEAAGLSAEHVPLHLPPGRPSQVIQSVAYGIDADLVVLGRHRPRHAFDGLLGSTAERVVRTSRVPCLLVNRDLEARPRRLMVATDLSAHADRALEVAVEWAHRWAVGPKSDRGAQAEVEVELVHISDFARPGYRPLGRGDILRRLAADASARADPRIQIRSSTASYPLAPEGIFEVARELEPDLVLMGTHGRGPALRLLFGSVASEVMRTLPLAVVLVPLPANG